MRWIGPVALAFVASSVVACDSAEDTKPASTFPDPFPYAWELSGHVRAGTEPVVGALVRVDPSPGFPADPQLLAAGDKDPRFARTTTTDAAGAYRLQFGPFVYDLSLTHDRDLYVFHNLVTRGFEPPFAVEAPVTGFKARVLPTTNPPARAGNATVYFVSGDDARTIVPVESNASSALDATFRHFDSTITLHAVEYVAASGPAAAVAEGKLDVHVRDGIVVTPVITMTLITLTGAATFEATPPPGYVLEPLAMEMDLGLRTSAVQLLTRIVPGQVLHFGVATDARYFVRARATKGEAVSDSGRYRVNPFDKNPLMLPSPVSSEAPIDDEAIPMGEGTTTSAPAEIASGGTLAARLETGIIEHALIPVSGTGTIIHVVTGERATTLPDAGPFGLAPPTGRYFWTVQSFPTLSFTDRLSGEDGRVSPPSWTSAPRVIVVR